MMTVTKPKSTTLPCGCVNDFHEPTGALRRVSTCRRHTRAQRAPETLGLPYYTKLGLLQNGMLQPTRHVAELVEALGPLPSPKEHDQALEISCGVSPYAGDIVTCGWNYCGLDASRWACGWMERSWGVRAINGRFENIADEELNYPFGLILAAHSFEHMDDAPGAVARCADLLAPGGELWIVIPDNTDLANPDHRWFFDQELLWFTVESTGLSVEKIELRRYVGHENFIYCRAKKSAQSDMKSIES